MVCRLTVGRDAYEEVETEMTGLLADADAARAEFLRLAGRDAAAFDAVMAAFKLPKDDDRRKAERSAAIQRAYEGAARVPLEVAELAIGLIVAATAVTERGNSNAASDGLSAAHALHAAAHAALANVAINASGLKDERVANELRDRLEGGRRRADELLASARSAFEARVG
jgi:formiminotetrahydrofolate cyclodeaminase